MNSLHESEDQLELYALDRLADDAVERVEEHLIVCETCRTRLEKVGEFAFTMKAGLRAAPLGHVPKPVGWFQGWNLRFALGGALAIAVLLAFFTYKNAGNVKFAPVATLTLNAIRGANTVTAPSREFDLTLADAVGEKLTVEVVDSVGKRVWKGPASTQGANARVLMKQSLEPGTYFVRLKTPSGEILHEYGLAVRP